MPNLTILDFQSSNIRFENRDGRVWVSLTDIAKASGKLLGHWNRLDSTKEFLSALESDIGYPIMQTIQGGVPSKQGTWAIEEVAIKFAGWCSVQFDIWMLRQIVSSPTVNDGATRIPFAWQRILESKNDQVKFVYLIGCKDNGTMKIGISSSPEKRIKKLQTSVAFALELIAKIQGTISLEQQLHREFSHLQLVGEWFKWSEDILQKFKNLQN